MIILTPIDIRNTAQDLLFPRITPHSCNAGTHAPYDNRSQQAHTVLVAIFFRYLLQADLIRHRSYLKRKHGTIVDIDCRTPASFMQSVAL